MQAMGLSDGGRPTHADLAAALDWWRLAGVDGDWQDAPQSWLAPVAATTPARASAPVAGPAPALPAPALPGGGPAAWPTELAQFAQWWLDTPDLAPAGARRIAPAGPANPPLMIVAAMPGAEDHDTLLSGRVGRMIDGFLAAAGLGRDQVYCASALPARIAAPDWTALASTGLGEVLRHHCALVRPQRVILFGEAGISALLGHTPPHKPTHLPPINHDGPMIPALYGYDLDAIVARPALKAGLWSRWLDWTAA
jgi:DNA polymerase